MSKTSPRQAEATTRTRTRKSPEARREAILDAAVNLVLEQGVMKATMARVASEAGVSKGLMYAYFDNRTDLMQQLLKREQHIVSEEQRKAIRSADSFEAMARETHRISESHKARRGRLIQSLKADASIEAVIPEVEASGRAEVMDYLARTVAHHFNLSEPLARSAIALLLGYDQPDSETGQKTEEIWGAMVQGAMLELQKRFGTGQS